MKALRVSSGLAQGKKNSKWHLLVESYSCKKVPSFCLLLLAVALSCAHLLHTNFSTVSTLICAWLYFKSICNLLLYLMTPPGQDVDILIFVIRKHLVLPQKITTFVKIKYKNVTYLYIYTSILIRAVARSENPGWHVVMWWA